MKTELLVATKNKKKLAEIKDILKGANLAISCLDSLPYKVRIVENGRSFKENAVKKAVVTARRSARLALGEDSGLCVRALGGAPGIYSARFSGKSKSDLKNNLKLLELLKGLKASRRKAYYACAVALADKKGLIGVVEGRCHGIIATELRGSSGFGYDPLFLIPERKKTFGQLGERIKHKMSHRYHALKKAKLLLQKYIVKRKRS